MSLNLNSNTQFNSIVLGAGVSGLVASSILKGNTLLIDRLHRYGGTSYVFKRKNYVFPTGPLGFSYPSKVKIMLDRIGIKKVRFFRKKYEIIAGKIRFIIPERLEDLGKILGKHFPEENFDIVIKKLKNVIENVKEKFYFGDKICKINWNGELSDFENVDDFKDLGCAREFFEDLMNDELAVNFMSSLGFKESEQSLYASACMWDIICETGIWYPESGLKKLVDSIFGRCNATFLKKSNVEWIEKDECFIIGTSKGEFKSDVLISSLDPFYVADISGGELKKLRKVIDNRKQGGSTLTVYIDAEKTPFEGNHALYYPWMDPENSKSSDSGTFYNREIEITPLSRLKEFNSGYILRVGMDYKEVRCKSREEYYELKKRLAEELAETVKHLIGDYKIIDVSTPLTYEVWGGRVNGSVVGWKWDDNFPRCLVKTNVDGFYITGIYSFTIPIYGGFPTSMLSGIIAGELAKQNDLSNL